MHHSHHTTLDIQTQELWFGVVQESQGKAEWVYCIIMTLNINNGCPNTL